jgi:hypothetical protein
MAARILGLADGTFAARAAAFERRKTRTHVVHLVSEG